MKNIGILFIVMSLVWVSCKQQSRYLDLSTGKEVKLEKDAETGLMVNAETKKPVYIYVDTKNNDTVYGSTGKVINGEVVKTESGDYKFRGDYKYKSPDGDLKVEVEKDGDVKIKDGDSKIKIDGETGEKKVKNKD
ncbi:MAG TPA: hypothetical protein VF487_02530 [Chitinophagaceae bacterium]